MYKACIFDLDGTLCDSVESLVYCGNHALRDLGLKEAAPEDYKRFVGDGVDVLLQRLLRFGGDEECALFQEMKARYLAYFREGCMYQVGPYPGVSEALEELKRQGAKIAVLSNKPHENARDVVEEIFGKGYFDCIVGQSERFPRKPAPDGALYIANVLGVKPEECLYVGDTGTDMQTGISAGMYTIGVLWGFRDQQELQEAGARKIIAQASQLPKIYCRNEERDRGNRV